MGETFGEADIVLRMRLDELDRDIRTAETKVMASTTRVESHRMDSLKSIATASRAASEDMRDQALAVGLLASKWAILRGLAGAALTAVGATAAAALTGTVALAGAALSVGVEFERATRTAVAGAQEARLALDGTTQKAREYAEALERIPAIGGAAGTAFRVMGGDAELANEALTKMFATIEDGEVKVGWWWRQKENIRRGILRAVQTPGGSPVGGAEVDDPVGDVSRANAEMRSMRAVQAVRESFLARTEGLAVQSAARSRAAQNAAMSEGLDGVEAIREAERQRFEAAESYYDTIRDKAEVAASQVNRIIASQQASGDLNASEAGLAYLQNSVSLNETINALSRDRAEEERAIAEQAERQVEAYKRQQAIAERNRADAITGLATSARASELRAAGKDFEAQRVEIESRAQLAITRAMEDGDAERAALERRYADARLAELQRAAQERYAAERRAEDQAFLAAEAARQRELDAQRRAGEQAFSEQARESEMAHRLDAQIAAAEARAEGRDADAERIRIEAEAWIEIQRALDDGNKERARLLARLRDLRLGQVDAERQRGRVREVGFAQLAASRFAAGGGRDGDDGKAERQRDKQVGELQKINKTLERGVVAFAGVVLLVGAVGMQVAGWAGCYPSSWSPGVSMVSAAS